MNELQPYSAPAPYNRPTDLQTRDVFAVIWRRKWLVIGIAVICIGLATLHTAITPKRYTSQAQLVLIQRTPTASSDSQDYQSPGVDSIQTQVGMLQSPAMVDRSVEWIKNNAIEHGEAADINDEMVSALGDLKVTNPPDSFLMVISVDGNSVANATLYCNAICQAFVQWKQDLARQDLQNAEQSLLVRADKAHSSVLTDEQELLAYQNSHNIVDLNASDAQIMGEVQILQNAIDGYQQEVSSQSARVVQLHNELQNANAEIMKGSTIRDDTGLAAMQEKLDELKAQRADAATKYTPNYPGVLTELDAQIKDLTARIRQSVAGTVTSASLPLQENIDATYRQSQVDLSTAQGKLATAVQQLAPLQQKLATMPGIGVRYKEMQQQLDLDTQLYTGLESALSSAKLDEDKTSSNVQVTQGAYTSSIPTSPVRIHDLLIGILASILFSILSLSIIEQFDRKVRTISDLHRIARLPLIGTLPLISRNDLPKLNQPVLPTEIAEALSLTRASLLRYFNAQSGKTLSGTILLTSAASGEGKSIVASELALTLARSGRSVMLIDANLRTPTVNTILDLPQSPGLSNMLLQNKSFDETLVLSEDVPTLSILTSGDIPDCASDLLSSARFAQILRDARYHADFVIIDSPSCSFSDPLLIAPYVDYSIQVVSLGQTAEDAVVATHNALLNAGSPSVGVLVNRTGKNDRQAFRIYGVHEALPSGQQTVSEKNNGSGDGDDKHTLLLSEGHLVDSGAKD